MFSDQIDFGSICLLFATPLILSLIFVPMTAYLAGRIGAIDHPNGRSAHSIPTPRLGGLAIFASLAVTCIAYLPFDRLLVSFLLGLPIIVATGLVDDIRGISPRWKFAGQILAASVFLFFSGMPLHGIGDIFGIGEISLGWGGFLFTVFFMVGAMNAFNLADGLDGLAGGIAGIAAVFLACLAWLAQSWMLVLLAMALCGSIAGFLRYNSYPARVFMGDCGSLMLGYTLSVMVVVLAQHQDLHGTPLVTVATVIALPLLDTLLVMARRMRNGKSPFLPDKTHIHHRLMELGLPHPVAVQTLYAAMLSFGLLAILNRDESEWMQLSYMLLGGALFFGSVSLMRQGHLRFGAAGRKPGLSLRRAVPDSSNS